MSREDAQSIENKVATNEQTDAFFGELQVDLARVEKFPEAGPLPWLDRPDAESEIAKRLSNGAIDPAEATNCEIGSKMDISFSIEQWNPICSTKFGMLIRKRSMMGRSGFYRNKPDLTTRGQVAVWIRISKSPRFARSCDMPRYCDGFVS
jgi:hypothetical protein